MNLPTLWDFLVFGAIITIYSVIVGISWIIEEIKS